MHAIYSDLMVDKEKQSDAASKTKKNNLTCLFVYVLTVLLGKTNNKNTASLVFVAQIIMHCLMSL